MNRKKIFYFTGIIVIIFAVLTVMISCEEKPTEPKNDNPFDRLNPQTGGDPFNLTARIADGRIILEWNKPDYSEARIYKIYRNRSVLNKYFLLLDSVDIGLNKYYDNSAVNGSTYLYKMSISFANNTESNLNKMEPTELFIPTDMDRAPTALFTTSLDENNSRLFHFNASASSDYEEGGVLEYRWDFDGDGNWDSDWLAQDTTYFIYPDTGDYYATLTVRDNNHYTDEMSKLVRNDPLIRDIDGNIYQTVRIGEQLWMVENLKVTHYRNGDAIPYVSAANIWMDYNGGAYCAYSSNLSNMETYGLLYNRYAVNDSRGLAPAGWHIPTDEDWQELINFLGGSSVAGGKLKESGINHWNSPNTGATNESVFTALPGGYRFENGIYYNRGDYGFWWSSSSYKGPIPWMSYKSLYTYFSHYTTNRDGYSIRCVQD